MNPKVFISYSWASSEHEEWVLAFANQLSDAGVHVILDKWDLKEGQDAHAFMETMVSDESIKKVLLICERSYVSKANSRIGGVGTESQIITPEIYGKKDQSKYVAVVRERDESGEACVPLYYKARIHIDLSNAASYAENFEKLVRWIYDKPLYVRPELGGKPSYLTENAEIVRLSTTAAFARAMDALKNGKLHAVPALIEYFDIFIAEFEKFRLDSGRDPFDEAVMESIKNFIPYRDEVVRLISTIITYSDNEETRTLVHRFFERMLPYQSAPLNSGSYRDWDWDNYAFITHELFLFVIAYCLKVEKFEFALNLIESEYHQPKRFNYGHPPMAPYLDFRTYLKSFEARNQRLQLRRLSLRADVLKERCVGSQVEFTHLMQADFVLYLRSKIIFKDQFAMWWPETLIYYGHRGAVFESFARSISRKYFEKIKLLIGVSSKEELGIALDQIETEQRLPQWQFETINPRYMCQFDLLATKN